MKGKHTYDLFITAHEVLHSMNKSKAKEAKLINLVLSDLRSASNSILVNGRTTDPFKPSKGIRQGDPLSPYIFILAMEFLNHLILNKVVDSLWLPFKFKQSKTLFSHLFFADDILLFLKPRYLAVSPLKKSLTLSQMLLVYN
ncbi:ribonuclease H [Senna tora]|uniref:Ribonuclease H n=1 Tax=Senna tora TaxID=362788 RepID=A0A834SQ04_9FABA|nr:ribonuclease H [Senna tora]